MKDRRVKDGRLLYHVELRETPHNTHVYNVDAERLQRELVGPWVRGQIVRFGDQEWIPQRSKITVLEGPHMPLGQLGLGKGWSNASRVSEDVTQRVLDAAQTALRVSGPPSTPSPVLVREIRLGCAVEPVSLRTVWRLAGSAMSTASAGEGLVLAERAVSELLRQGAVELCRGGAAGALPLTAEEAERVLGAVEEWSSEAADAVFVRAAAAASSVAGKSA
jgi:hypothetical protein